VKSKKDTVFTYTQTIIEKEKLLTNTVRELFEKIGQNSVEITMNQLKAFRRALVILVIVFGSLAIAAEEIVSAAERNRQIIVETVELMNKIRPQIEETTQLVQEMAAAGNEQSIGASQINSAVQILNGLSQKSANSAEEMSSSAADLSNLANTLKIAIDYFKVEEKHHFTQKKELQKSKDKKSSYKSQ
jgi:methyl-accepting chemotaxis protein